MRTDFPTPIDRCRHEVRSAGQVEVVACATCRRVEWFEQGRPTDPDAGLAALFGGFDLVARLPAVGAPGEEVFLYRPSRRGRRDGLELFPAHVWLRASELLWLCHDGTLLMLAPNDPLLARRLASD